MSKENTYTQSAYEASVRSLLVSAYELWKLPIPDTNMPLATVEYNLIETLSTMITHGAEQLSTLYRNIELCINTRRGINSTLSMDPDDIEERLQTVGEELKAVVLKPQLQYKLCIVGLANALARKFSIAKDMFRIRPEHLIYGVLRYLYKERQLDASTLDIFESSMADALLGMSGHPSAADENMDRADAALAIVVRRVLNTDAIDMRHVSSRIEFYDYRPNNHRSAFGRERDHSFGDHRQYDSGSWVRPNPVDPLFRRTRTPDPRVLQAKVDFIKSVRLLTLLVSVSTGTTVDVGPTDSPMDTLHNLSRLSPNWSTAIRQIYDELMMAVSHSDWETANTLIWNMCLGLATRS